jgi:hypothetical protein
VFDSPRIDVAIRKRMRVKVVAPAIIKARVSGRVSKSPIPSRLTETI